MAYSNSWTNSTPGTPLTVTVAPNANDVLIMWCVSDVAVARTITWPAGFTEVDSITSTFDNTRLGVAIKNQATGSETSLSVSNDGSDNLIGGVAAYSGRDNTTPQDVAAVTATSNTSVANISGSITPASGGCDIVAILDPDIVGGNPNITFSTTSGTTGAWTTRADQSDGGFFNVGQGDATQTTAGAITVQGASSISGGMCLVVMALRAGAATATTLTGPTSGYRGQAQTFTVGANGPITGTVVITPSDGGAGGTFTPTTVSISSGSPTGTFVYGNNLPGTYTISISDNGGLTDAASINLALTVAPGPLSLKDELLRRVAAPASASPLDIGGWMPKVSINTWFMRDWWASATSGAVSKSAGDTGTSSEATAIASSTTQGDTGTAAESSATTAQFPAADTGSAAEATAAQAGTTSADAGSGAEGAASAGTATAADTGSGAEATAIAVTLAGSDTGAGAEATAVSVVNAGADTGSGSEATSTQAGIAGADTGAGAEASATQAGASGADTGSGTESTSTQAALTAADTGSGAEGQSVSTSGGTSNVSSSDTGAGAEATVIAASSTVGDAAIASEASATLAASNAADAGSASDTAANTANFSRADTGAATEASSTQAGASGADTGASGDSPGVLAIMSASDSASASDAGSTSLAGAIPIVAADLGTAIEAFYLAGAYGVRGDGHPAGGYSARPEFMPSGRPSQSPGARPAAAPTVRPSTRSASRRPRQ